MSAKLHVSIVMPFYRNEKTLLGCLTSFARQHQDGVCEIIVVDDGEYPAAERLAATQSFPVPIKHFTTPRLGQSAATNQGIQQAAGDLVLLTCADIIAAPKLVRAHCEAHQKASDVIAVQGYLPYAPWLKQTPFMRYLQKPGPQFSFQTIDTPEDLDPGHIYAPNFSAKKSSLVGCGLFDELFPYGFQDIDLGFRLKSIGVRLIYCAKAIGYHDHPTDLATFLRRQEKVGESLPRMMLRNWTQKQRDIVATRLKGITAQLNQEKEWLEAVRQIEAQVGQSAQAFAHAEAELSGLYTRLSSTAIVRGALKQGDDLRKAAPALAHALSNFSAPSVSA